MPNQSKAELATDALKKAGVCPACDLPLENHPQCESCLIFCGPNHDYNLTSYRHHKICTMCAGKWKGVEARIGRVVEWPEFLRPTPSTSK